jgi:uncharacterized protein (DUF1778 family)
MSNSNNERIDFRCNKQDKAVIYEAASLLGMTVSSFSKSTLLERAHQIIQSASITTLSVKDSELFLALLESDSEPSPSLLAAAQRYREK